MDSGSYVGIVASVIALVAAGIAVWQAKSAGRSATAAEIANSHAETNADAAVRSADAAEESLNLQRADAQRAASTVEFEAEREKGNTSSYFITNRGRSTAYAVSITGGHRADFHGENGPATVWPEGHVENWSFVLSGDSRAKVEWYPTPDQSGDPRVSWVSLN